MWPQSRKQSRVLLPVNLASRLVTDTLIYGLVGHLPKIFSIATLPFVYRGLTPDKYGLTEYLFTLIVWLSALGSFGIDSAFARFLFDGKNTEDHKNLFSQSLLLLLASTITLSFLLEIFKDPIISKIGVSLSTYYLALISIPFYAIANFVLVTLRWTCQRSSYIRYSILQSLLQPLLLFAMALSDSITINHAFQVYLILLFLLSWLGLFILRDLLCIPRSLNSSVKLIQYAIPIWISTSVLSFGPTLERFLVYSFAGTDILGQYIATSKVAGIVLYITSAFHMALGPLVFGSIGLSPASTLYASIFSLHTYFASITSIGLFVLASWLLPLSLGSSYTLPSIIVLLLIVSNFVTSTTSIVELGIHISKRTGILLTTLAINLSVLLTVFFLLVRHFNLPALPIAILSASIATLYATISFSTKVSSISWRPRRPALLALSYGSLFGLLGQIFPPTHHSLLIIFLLISIPISWALYLNTNEKKIILNVPRLLQARFSNTVTPATREI